MSHPNPYFEDIPQLGNLKIDYIILEYDYPLLFTCTNEKGDLFLCVCCEVFKEQRWLIVPTTTDAILDLLNNKVSGRDLFKNAEGTCCVACWSQDYNMTYCLMESKDFDPEDLPDRDSRLNPDYGEFDDYIEELQSRKDDPHVTFPR